MTQNIPPINHGQTGPTPLLPRGTNLDTIPDNPNLSTMNFLLLSAQAIQYVLIGEPTPATMSVADLVTAYRRLWGLHTLAYAADRKRITSEKLLDVLTILLG